MVPVSQGSSVQHTYSPWDNLTAKGEKLILWGGKKKKKKKSYFFHAKSTDLHIVQEKIHHVFCSIKISWGRKAIREKKIVQKASLGRW